MKSLSTSLTLTSGTQHSSMNARRMLGRNAGPRLPQHQPRWQPPQNTAKTSPRNCISASQKLSATDRDSGRGKSMALPSSLWPKAEKEPRDGWEKAGLLTWEGAGCARQGIKKLR